MKTQERQNDEVVQKNFDDLMACVKKLSGETSIPKPDDKGSNVKGKNTMVQQPQGHFSVPNRMLYKS